MPKKKTTGKQKAGRPERDGAAGRGAGAAHHQHAGDQLYALRHDRHRLARHSGDRRLQALPPQAAVHHVRMGLLTGARTKSANIVGQTMQAEPPRRRRHLRDHGAPGPRQRDAAAPLCGLQGQLRQGLLPRYGLRRLPLHRGEARADLRELFRDIDADTVDFVDNYDGSIKEPVLLPTTFPNVLVSANMGIAVGMASNICSLQSGRGLRTTIALIKNPDADLLDTLPAPDFPTGGEILYDPARCCRSTRPAAARSACGQNGAMSRRGT